MTSLKTFSSGQPDAHVEIGTKVTDKSHHYILFVCDNSIGINPQYSERIFGLFNKLNPRLEGTGIGPTLVK
jgi:light-regulated signal transduction histidine kinase (bacteriophytochrome)